MIEALKLKVNSLQETIRENLSERQIEDIRDLALTMAEIEEILDKEWRAEGDRNKAIRSWNLTQAVRCLHHLIIPNDGKSK